MNPPPCINCISLAICRTRLIHNRDIGIYEVGEKTNLAVRFVIKDCKPAKEFIYINKQTFYNINEKRNVVLKTYNDYRCALLYDYFINLENSTIVTGVGM
jgi:hypothetical protein